MKKRQNKKTKHHIIPRSRNGKNTTENILLKRNNKHQAYHLLFNNSLPEEAVKILIDEWFYQNKTLKQRKIADLIIWLERQVQDYVQKQRIAGFRAGAGC